MHVKEVNVERLPHIGQEEMEYKEAKKRKMKISKSFKDLKLKSQKTSSTAALTGASIALPNIKQESDGLLDEVIKSEEENYKKIMNMKVKGPIHHKNLSSGVSIAQFDKFKRRWGPAQTSISKVDLGATRLTLSEYHRLREGDFQRRYDSTAQEIPVEKDFPKLLEDLSENKVTPKPSLDHKMMRNSMSMKELRPKKLKREKITYNAAALHEHMQGFIDIDGHNLINLMQRNQLFDDINDKKEDGMDTASHLLLQDHLQSTYRTFAEQTLSQDTMNFDINDDPKKCTVPMPKATSLKSLHFPKQYSLYSTDALTRRQIAYPMKH